ncbi:hypothetical protein C8R46DRAFT_1029732 [Mycena filopes]|nr:hypothetical protein C8R46DRAFT_1029732 [Mycena filopes]
MREGHADAANLGYSGAWNISDSIEPYIRIHRRSQAPRFPLKWGQARERRTIRQQVPINNPWKYQRLTYSPCAQPHMPEGAPLFDKTGPVGAPAASTLEVFFEQQEQKGVAGISARVRRHSSSPFETAAEHRCRLSKEEKAESHRRAQRKYRAGSTDLREKQRLYAAEKRAAVKARRRVRDPPKPTRLKKPASLPSSDVPFQDFRAGSDVSFPTFVRAASEQPRVGTAGSPTPDERLACDALADLAQGGPRAITDGGPVDLRDVLSEQRSETSMARAALLTAPMETSLGKLPTGLAPLTETQIASVERSGAVGILTRVQSIQMRVALMNREPPPPSTGVERSRWAVNPPVVFDRFCNMSHGGFRAVEWWRYWASDLEQLDPHVGSGEDSPDELPALP